MEIRRGEIWWADLEEPVGSGPGDQRPVLIIQGDAFNRSRLSTTIVVALTSNLRLVDAPGNVLLPARLTDLPRDSVANVSQSLTLDRDVLGERVGRLTPTLLRQVEEGLQLVLDV